MKCWQSGCILATVLTYLASPAEAGADELGEEQESGSAQVTPLTKDQYESEAIVLEKWKIGARGTYMGKQLMGMLDTLNGSLVRNPRDVQSLYNRGYLYGTVGCTRAAIYDLSKAIQVDPMSSNLYCERGICYFDNQDYAKAMRDLSKAIELNPNSGDAHLARGRLYLWLEQPLKALPDLQASLTGEYSPALPGELPGNFFHAPEYYLGICHEILGNPNEARKYYEQSAKDASDRTGADRGYIHRYADQPADSTDKASKFHSG